MAVFISYSRADRPYVDELAAHLRASGIDVWYDHSLAAGDRFPSEIQARIDTCTAFVVVMTPAAVDSEWVDREIAYAALIHKPLVPLLRAPCRTHILLANVHQEDVSDGSMPGESFVGRLRAVRDATSGGARGGAEQSTDTRRLGDTAATASTGPPGGTEDTTVAPAPLQSTAATSVATAARTGAASQLVTPTRPTTPGQPRREPPASGSPPYRPYGASRPYPPQPRRILVVLSGGAIGNAISIVFVAIFSDGLTSPIALGVSSVLGLMAVLYLALYFRLIGIRDRTAKHWEQVAAQLQVRSDLAFKLVDVCKRVVPAERGVLDAVLAARIAAVGADGAVPATRVTYENELSEQLDRLIAFQAVYPDLSADAAFVALRDQLSHLRTALAASRDSYDDAARLYNSQLDNRLIGLVARSARLPAVTGFDLR